MWNILSNGSKVYIETYGCSASYSDSEICAGQLTQEGYSIVDDPNDSDINISISGKYRLGDIRHNYADLTKINNILGFTPKYNFQEGISRFARWVKRQEINEDQYESSIVELKEKGLIKWDY